MPAAADPGRALAGRTVLAVFAHPDDESLACGGTLARLADGGARVVLLCASRGERGSVADPSLLDGSDLGAVRSHELSAAAAVLGVSRVILLDHPDGDLRWSAVAELHAEIVGAIETFAPDLVITFAEDGLYWHLDHIGVHERTLTAVKSLGDRAPALYYVTIPKGVMRAVLDSARAKVGVSASSFWGIEPEAFVEAIPATFTIDVRDWVPRKLAALRCHRTQMGPTNPMAWIDDDDARRWLGVEYFRRSPITAAGPDLVLERLGEPVQNS